MWKAILAGTATVAIVGSSLVYAQQGQRGPEGGQRWQISQEDMAAFADARIAALKAGLRLTPDQEKNWANFETALRDMGKARRDRMTARPNEQRPADPVERLRRQADALSGAGARLKTLADAQEPLYKSLDDGQKRRFHILSRMLRPHHPSRMAMRERWRGSQGRTDGRGFGGPDQGPRGPALQGPGGERRGREG